MRTSIKYNAKKAPAKSRKPAVAKNSLPDLSNDPYFKEKAEKASQLLEKYGTPQK